MRWCGMIVCRAVASIRLPAWLSFSSPSLPLSLSPCSAFLVPCIAVHTRLLDSARIHALLAACTRTQQPLVSRPETSCLPLLSSPLLSSPLLSLLLGLLLLLLWCACSAGVLCFADNSLHCCAAHHASQSSPATGRLVRKQTNPHLNVADLKGCYSMCLLCVLSTHCSTHTHTHTQQQRRVSMSTNRFYAPGKLTVALGRPPPKPKPKPKPKTIPFTSDIEDLTQDSPSPPSTPRSSLSFTPPATQPSSSSTFLSPLHLHSVIQPTHPIPIPVQPAIYTDRSMPSASTVKKATGSKRTSAPRPAHKQTKKKKTTTNNNNKRSRTTTRSQSSKGSGRKKQRLHESHYTTHAMQHAGLQQSDRAGHARGVDSCQTIALPAQCRPW